MWLLYEVMAGGSWQDAALMSRSFKGPISVYSPADQSIDSFAEIWPLFGLYAVCAFPCDFDVQCRAFNFNGR